MKKSIRQATVYFAAAAIIFAAILVFTGCIGNTGKTPQASGSSSSPDFTLPDLEGNQVTLSSLEGKVVVINFWATWCPPCKAEIPDFIEVYDSYSSRGVEFLGISAEDKDLLVSFAEDYGINYPVLIDETGSVFQAYGVSAIPQTYIVNPEGEIVFKQTGLMSKSQLSSAIDSALE